MSNHGVIGVGLISLPFVLVGAGVAGSIFVIRESIKATDKARVYFGMQIDVAIQRHREELQKIEAKKIEAERQAMIARMRLEAIEKQDKLLEILMIKQDIKNTIKLIENEPLIKDKHSFETNALKKSLIELEEINSTCDWSDFINTRKQVIKLSGESNRLLKEVTTEVKKELTKQLVNIAEEIIKDKLGYDLYTFCLGEYEAAGKKGTQEFRVAITDEGMKFSFQGFKGEDCYRETEKFCGFLKECGVEIADFKAYPNSKGTWDFEQTQKMTISVIESLGLDFTMSDGIPGTIVKAEKNRESI